VLQANIEKMDEDSDVTNMLANMKPPEQAVSEQTQQSYKSSGSNSAQFPLFGANLLNHEIMAAKKLN
jgi:hypothetical protein